MIQAILEGALSAAISVIAFCIGWHIGNRRNRY